MLPQISRSLSRVFAARAVRGGDTEKSTLHLICIAATTRAYVWYIRTYRVPVYLEIASQLLFMRGATLASTLFFTPPPSDEQVAWYLQGINNAVLRIVRT